MPVCNIALGTVEHASTSPTAGGILGSLALF